jgi:hypothetical protein
MAFYFERDTFENFPHRLGLMPSDDDRAWVRAQSAMGRTIGELSVMLGERFKLGKPMWRGTMYYHFREELGTRPLGRKRIGPPALADDMKALLKTVDSRGKDREARRKKRKEASQARA